MSLLRGREMEGRFCDGNDLKKQELRLLMERFGATKNGVMIAKALKEMVGTRRLELLTSTKAAFRRNLLYFNGTHCPVVTR